MMFDCDHLCEVCLSGQKVANISLMINKDLREEEYLKTVVLCVDCHRMKTNIFGKSKEVKPLVSEEELKHIQNCIQKCKCCKNKKRVVFFVAPCKMTPGLSRKYNQCNACRQKDQA
jgi:hypothetical protein